MFSFEVCVLIEFPIVLYLDEAKRAKKNTLMMDINGENCEDAKEPKVYSTIIHKISETNPLFQCF